MKKKDIVTIVLIGVFAGIISLFTTQALFVSNKDKRISVEVVDPISAQFNEPDKRIFTQNAVNPTQLIRISENSNTTPF